MFWIILIIIVIVLIVRGSKKKKAQQSQQPQAPATAAAKAEPAKSEPAKSSAPPKAGDKLDHDAFARAFAHMSGDGPAPKTKPAEPEPVKKEPAKLEAPKPEPVKEEPVKSEPAKSEPAKSSAPPKAGDKLDHDAFARAFAHMSGEDPTPWDRLPREEPAKPEPPTPEPPTPEPPTPEPPIPAAVDEKPFLDKLLSYYQSCWDKDTGTTYTKLGGELPIEHFSLQVRSDRIIETLCLSGDEIPTVREVLFDQVAPGVPRPAYDSADAQSTLLVQLGAFLMELPTLDLQGNDFYPIRGLGAKAPGGQSAGGSKADEQARLRAQIQAMMEKQKKDGPKK